MIPSHKSIHFDNENTTVLAKVSFEQNCQSQEGCRREEEQEPSKLMGHLDQHVKWQSSFNLETQCNHSSCICFFFKGGSYGKRTNSLLPHSFG